VIFHSLFVLLDFTFASADLGEPIFGLSSVHSLPLDRLLVCLLVSLLVRKPTGAGKILFCFSICADLFLLLKSPAILSVLAGTAPGLRSSFVLIFRSAPVLVLALIDSCVSVLLPLDSVFVPTVALRHWSYGPKIFSPSSKECRPDFFSALSFSSRWNRGPVSRPPTQFGLRMKDFVFRFYRRTPIFCLRAHRSQPRYCNHADVHSRARAAGPSSSFLCPC
jgi:hypothetical protein